MYVNNPCCSHDQDGDQPNLLAALIALRSLEKKLKVGRRRKELEEKY